MPRRVAIGKHDPASYTAALALSEPAEHGAAAAGQDPHLPDQRRLKAKTPESFTTRYEQDSPTRSKVVDTDRDNSAPRHQINAYVASCVIRVRELAPSLKFYRDVFSCDVAVHETDMALLIAPNGFHIYLHAPSQHHRAPTAAGIQYLLWSTDTESDLHELTQRLRAHDPAVFSHTENGVTIIEGVDPDGGRVLIGYPSPFKLPRAVIAARLHA